MKTTKKPKPVMVDTDYLREERRKAFNAGVKAAVKALVARGRRIADSDPMSDQFIEEWRRNLDGKTFSNTKSTAVFDATHSVEALLKKSKKSRRKS